MRKQTIFKLTSLILFAVIFLTACNGGSTETPTATVDVNSVIATSIAQTMQAMSETQAAMATPTPAATATSMALPSVTPATAVGLPTATVQTVSLPTNCLIAGLVSETIPDGTVIGRGSTFTKTWSIRNGGTCTWTTGYKMVFETGEKLGATADSFALTQSVAPGMMTAVSIKMTAPNTDGTYIGYWDLMTDSGVLVGRFSVNIYVGVATEAPFSVTSVTYNSSFTGLTCDGVNPSSIPIYIKTDGAGTVSYTLHDLNVPPDFTADASDDFPATGAGTYTIYYNMVFPNTPGGTVDVEMTVYIDKPNHQTFTLKFADGQCK